MVISHNCWVFFFDIFQTNSHVTCTKVPLTQEQIKTLKKLPYQSNSARTFKIWNFLSRKCTKHGNFGGFVKNVLTTRDIVSGEICGHNPTFKIRLGFNCYDLQKLSYVLRQGDVCFYWLSFSPKALFLTY